ncbi:MAG: hypothetical protein NDI94_06865, partial [Candidatus Woesearchaeota archaeon]|nr:hypothetical protein [Candidatus Woesearchaeota archaeon]
KAKRLCEDNGRKDVEDALIIKTIMEERNLADSFAELTREEVKFEPVIKIRHVQTRVSKEYLENLALKETIRELEEENSQLKKENEMLRDKKIDIPGKLKNIISFKEQRALVLEGKNRKLKKDNMHKESIIEKLNGFIMKSDGKRIVKILKNLGSDEYALKRDLLDIRKRDILYIEDIGIISQGVLEEIKGCVVMTGAPKPINGIDVIKDISTDKNKYFALADEEEIEREQRALRKKDTIKDILEDYKKERLKEII